MNEKMSGSCRCSALQTMVHFWQAYALKQLIEELGCKVEFVDYHVGAPVITENADSKNKFVRKCRKGDWKLFGIRLRLHTSCRSFIISSLFPKSICHF